MVRTVAEKLVVVVVVLMIGKNEPSLLLRAAGDLARKQILYDHSNVFCSGRLES